MLVFEQLLGVETKPVSRDTIRNAAWHKVHRYLLTHDRPSQ